ncbi:MAG: redoxin domain-containing protein [Anaerolineales bacterium]|nr:redoxin domain-containing protein [Anaerolineales bacterium]
MLRLVRLVLSLVLIMVAVPQLVHAEDTIQVQPQSGRYSLEIPADWVVSTDEVRGLGGSFRGEIVAVADSEAAMRSLQSNNRTLAVSGRTLIANVFATAQATYGQQVDDPNTVFQMILQSSADTAEFLTINGLPAVHVNDYPGPPYENATFSGLTMILDGELIYYVVYAGPDQASFDELMQIVETLTPLTPSATAFGERPAFAVDQLQLPLLPEWMVLSSGTSEGGVEYYMVVPDPKRTLNYAIGFGDAADLPGMFIHVQSQPYDFLYSTVDYETTEDDRAFVLGQALANTGGEPLLGIENLTINDKTGLQIELEGAFGGDNRGVIVLIDSGLFMYTLTMVAPAADWDTVYLPLMDDFIAHLSLTENSIGVQVGQIAPDFTLTLLDGSQVRLSDLRGQTVLVNFWATWCPPCRAEMPAFQSKFGAGDSGATIIAVNLMESPDTIQPFVDELGLTIPIGLDLGGDVNNLFNIQYYPTTYVINAEGIIEVAHIGPTDENTIVRWLEIAQD